MKGKENKLISLNYIKYLIMELFYTYIGGNEMYNRKGERIIIITGTKEYGI